MKLTDFGLDSDNTIVYGTTREVRCREREREREKEGGWDRKKGGKEGEEERGRAQLAHPVPSRLREPSPRAPKIQSSHKDLRGS